MKDEPWTCMTAETKLCDTKLSVRAQNCAHNYDVASLGDLAAYTELGVFRWRNCGVRTLQEYRMYLAAAGLAFTPHPDGPLSLHPPDPPLDPPGLREASAPRPDLQVRWARKKPGILESLRAYADGVGTLQAIADRHNLSRERVRQMAMYGGFDKARRALRSAQLDAYANAALQRAGRAPDTVVAAELGVNPTVVAAVRRKHGIPPFRPSRIGDVLGAEPTRSRLGVDSDNAIARDIGMSAPMISAWRTKQGIPPATDRWGRTYDEAAVLADCADDLGLLAQEVCARHRCPYARLEQIWRAAHPGEEYPRRLRSPSWLARNTRVTAAREPE